jgi:hypothetical protein
MIKVSTSCFASDTIEMNGRQQDFSFICGTFILHSDSELKVLSMPALAAQRC